MVFATTTLFYKYICGLNIAAAYVECIGHL